MMVVPPFDERHQRSGIQQPPHQRPNPSSRAQLEERSPPPLSTQPTKSTAETGVRDRCRSRMSRTNSAFETCACLAARSRDASKRSGSLTVTVFIPHTVLLILQSCNTGNLHRQVRSPCIGRLRRRPLQTKSSTSTIATMRGSGMNSYGAIATLRTFWALCSSAPAHNRAGAMSGRTLNSGALFDVPASPTYATALLTTRNG